MKRRTLLAAIGAGLGGTGAAAARSSHAGDAATPRTDRRRVAVPGSPVAALAVDPAPGGTPLRHDVTLHGQPAPGEPARLTVTVENADDRAHAVRVADETLPHARRGDAPDRVRRLDPGERASHTVAVDVRDAARDRHPFAARFVVDRDGESVAYRWGFAVETA